MTSTTATPFLTQRGDELVPNPIAHGGWGPTLGGQVVGGLLARAIEAQVDDVDLHPARLTVEILRRGATEPVRVSATVVRAGALEEAGVAAATGTTAAHGAIDLLGRGLPVRRRLEHRSRAPPRSSSARWPAGATGPRRSRRGDRRRRRR